MYGKDLLADLKSELHGDFEDLVLALMERPPVYDAMQLRKAMEVHIHIYYSYLDFFLLHS